MHSRGRKPVFSSGQKLGVGVANTVPWEDTICSTFVFCYPQSCSLVNLLTELTGQGKHDGTLNEPSVVLSLILDQVDVTGAFSF